MASMWGRVARLVLVALVSSAMAVLSAGPAAAAPPGFGCSPQSGGSFGGGVSATTVQASQEAGFDRFAIQFDGPVPPYSVVPQDSATFVGVGSGKDVTLLGTAGLHVTMTGASLVSYTGPADVVTGFSELREARLLGGFEGDVQWGLGLAAADCFRAQALTGPDRLVIDVLT